jgi:hydroxymethylpyrimidine pyrophosphatase-like HAD family hydrolase
LRALREQGVQLALASGRHFKDVRAVSEPFGSDVYTISSDGTGEAMGMP